MIYEQMCSRRSTSYLRVTLDDDIQLPIELSRSRRETVTEIRLMYFGVESQGSNLVYLTDAIIP